MTNPDVYFERIGAGSYRPTPHVSGGWNTAEQHVAPGFGLLAHLIERDRDERGSSLVLGRLSFDILGTIGMDTVDCDVEVIRPGRTIELVEATMRYGGRAVIRLRAWLMSAADTSAIAGTPLPSIPGPDELDEWAASEVWPGGFIASAQVRRREVDLGHAIYWVRTEVALVDDEPVSSTARAVGLLDIANGIASRMHPNDLAYPNLDLTAHLFDQPAGDWLGFDTCASFGPGGVGLTSSRLYDRRGAIGTVAQILTLRPH